MQNNFFLKLKSFFKQADQLIGCEDFRIVKKSGF